MVDRQRPTTRTQDTSLGTTFQINAGKFVTMTDMGQAATSAGANGVFGSPGLPDADDVVTTKFIYNVVVNNAGTSADFNASQHIQSLKINSGAIANLNTFTYGSGAATTLQTDLLGVDTGAGTLNIGAATRHGPLRHRRVPSWRPARRSPCKVEARSTSTVRKRTACSTSAPLQPLTLSSMTA